MPILKTIGTFFTGNNLNGQNPPSTAQSSPTPTTTKRPKPSDSGPTNPTKRRRFDENPNEAISISSSPGAHDRSRLARHSTDRRSSHDSASLRSTKGGFGDNQSLRSSGDRQFRGGEIDELRATDQRVSLKSRGGSRPRHSKKNQNSAKGHTQQARESAHGQKASQGPPFKNRRLVHCIENKDDPIDNDDSEISEVHSIFRNKRYAAAPFATDQFQEGAILDDSEDDLIGEGGLKFPTSIQRESTTKRTAGITYSERTKRRAPSPDELQDSYNFKRRSRSVREAEPLVAHSTSKRMPDGHGGNRTARVMKIDSAVRDPNCIYTLENSLDDVADEASLLWTGPEKSLFKVVNGALLDLSNSDWMIPDLSKVIHIHYNEYSPVVHHKLRVDNRPESPGGPNLLIKFRAIGDAGCYIDLCREANKSISLVEKEVDKLDKTFNKQMDVVKDVVKRNINGKRKPSSEMPEDLKLLSRMEAIGQRRPTQSTSRTLDETRLFNRDHSKKSMAAQMESEPRSQLVTPVSKSKSKQASSITPAEEKQMRALVSDDEIKNCGEENEFSLRTARNQTSPQLLQADNSRTQRSLRSSQPAVRSPSPLPERWTLKNPNWIVERGWSIPLVYGRTTVNSGDIVCLDEGQFLNDAIISFYAKYLHIELEKKNGTLARKVYIFNSFFFETLKAKGYDGVKSWTTKVDLCSYDYIVVPINQNTHWYLAIICNPGALVPQDEPDDEVQEVVHERREDDEVLSDNTSEAKVANVTSDLSQVSIEDHLDSTTTSKHEGMDGTYSTKKSKGPRRRVAPRKYDPKAPRVITLDSLDGSHSAVATHLKNYLIQEIKERKGLEVPAPSSFGTAAKDIPMQQNFTDCGVYLLGYIEEFMKDPHKFTRRILQQEKRDWDVDAPDLRNKIRLLIFEQQKKHQEEEMQRKRIRREVAIKARAPSSARSSADSEQKTTRKASRSPAADRTNTQRSTNSPSLDTNGNSNGAELKTSNSKSPTPLARVSSPLRSPRIDDNEPPNVNASMIVHPNVSIELDTEQSHKNASSPCKMDEATEIDDDPVHETPRPSMKLSESRQTSVSRQGSGSRQSSESLQTPRNQPGAGNYDTRTFLTLLKPSPSASPAPVPVPVPRNSVRPGDQPLSKHATPKQDPNRSKYFETSSSTMKSSGSKFSQLSRQNKTSHHQYTSVDSSSEEEKVKKPEKSRHKSKSKASKASSQAAIDLTTLED